MITTQNKCDVAKSISTIENELLKMPQSDIKTEHLFYDGIYERKITIPAWTVLTGAEHLTDYRVRLEKGTIAVNTDDDVKILTAPYEFEAKAGMKRIGRVFDETVVWVDIYENKDNCRDLSKIESRLYELSNCELGDNRVRKEIEEDRKDFDLFLSQFGISHEDLSKIVEIDSDLIPMPDEYFVELRDSKLSGKGLFATRNFKAGETICAGRLNGCRTPAGRFINHSLRKNTVPELRGDDIYAVAIRDIYENEEILIDYRDSMQVNFNLKIGG